MEKYVQPYTILASDMDITYHVTPNAIMLYFQDCFARYLTSKRLAAFDIIKQDLIWVISDFDVNFVKERPLWKSNIRVAIQFREISSIRIYADYWMYDQQGECFAEGTSTWAIINTKTRRPIAAQELLEAGGIFADGEKRKKTICPKTPEDALIKTIQHPVNVTDLDFNGHVCNRTYLTIAMSMLSLDFVKTYSLRHMNIKFVRESFLGDTLTCNVSKGEAQNYWCNIVNESGKSICEIYGEWADNRETLSKDVSELIDR